MRSLLIEFHRFGALGTGLLREGDRYLVAAAVHPVREFSMPIDYKPFRCKMQALRYKGNPADRARALSEVGIIVTDMLGTKNLSDVNDGEFPLQLDLVVNAAELAALPFEAAIDESGAPLLVRTDKPIILTRRVRHDFAEVRLNWPAKPRILFAWACPAGAGVNVPYEEHLSALRAALEPWIPTREPTQSAIDPSGVLTVLSEASIDSIKKACENSFQKQPFSHVHILAHGCTIGRDFDQRFGIALHDPGSGGLLPASPEELGEALAPLRNQPVIVTLATCDAANETKTIIPERSIAHLLHISGIPVVVASQLPLTVPGSNLVVEHFYGALLEGKDVRDALYQARLALFENRDRTGHDWASLVGYVQLPEGYAEHLHEVELQSVLTSLKILQSWADELLKGNVWDSDQFDRLVTLLRGRVEVLERSLSDTEEPPNRGVLGEHLGLLGSAEKRLAELYFEHSVRSGSTEWRQEMQDSLKRARSWYQKGFDCNLSHHWDGVQFLSLEAILSGTISDPGFWYAAVKAAEIDLKRPKECWACGSLAELYLLAPVAGLPDATDKAAGFLKKMKTRVGNSKDSDRFPLESTERQFRRYTRWWTNQNSFFPGRRDLSVQAMRLVEVLTR